MEVQRIFVGAAVICLRGPGALYNRGTELCSEWQSTEVLHSESIILILLDALQKYRYTKYSNKI